MALTHGKTMLQIALAKLEATHAAKSARQVQKNTDTRPLGRPLPAPRPRPGVDMAKVRAGDVEDD